jgi:dolichol-phosphate mannosyltransferase
VIYTLNERNGGSRKEFMRIGAPDVMKSGSHTLEENLQSMERSRENYWRRYPGTSPIKLRWRATTVRHAFHVLPGQTILELGAGTGYWTRYLTEVLRGENPITATVFNQDYFDDAEPLPNVTYVKVGDLSDLPADSFDYIVGTAILCHDQYPQNLRALYRLLKPGGQILFFEANYWNPQVALKNAIPALGRWAGQVECQVGMRKYQLLRMASHRGFIDVDIIPYDIVHPAAPRFLIRWLQTLAFVLEHMPVVRDLCGTLYIWARKPGDLVPDRRGVNLANRKELFGAVSFVVPCHNEEMNIVRLVDELVKYYDPYIHEIVLVNDNSSDRTAEVAADKAKSDPRIKIINRTAPNGVGRALRDGYAAATGRYIFSMDCDFVQIFPEYRDLFDVVADGHDGAIGSRFSNDSLLVNYPFLKILANRCFHLLANLTLPIRMRDISNNLKLYRADILKNLDLEQPHFAANAETGLKPLLAGYDIREVPISWINRTIDMGSSSFRIAAIAPNYLAVLVRMVAGAWWRRTPKALAGKAANIRNTQ